MDRTWVIDSACEEVRIYSSVLDLEEFYDYIIIDNNYYNTDSYNYLDYYDYYDYLDFLNYNNYDTTMVDQVVSGHFEVYFHSNRFVSNELQDEQSYNPEFKGFKLHWSCTWQPMIDGSCDGIGNWSSYFSVDNGPNSTIDNPPNGDIEPRSLVLANPQFVNSASAGLCDGDDIVAAEARHKDGLIAGSNLGSQSVTLSKDTGLVCNDADQVNATICNDYEVRYCCKCTFQTSQLLIFYLMFSARSIWNSWGNWACC